MFTPIDEAAWPRRKYFDHYYRQVPCSYSICAKLDVSAVRARGYKLYPALLYAIATIVNRHEEFRTAFDGEGRLGIYDRMLPCYTIFHKDSQTFSNVWTEYSEDFQTFCAAYEKDKAAYGDVHGFTAKPNVPQNVFDVSMLPWVSFEGFNLNLPQGNGYLLPIFTLGKCSGGIMPIAVQVHHAVCDGFHVSRFLQELQELLHDLH